MKNDKDTELNNDPFQTKEDLFQKSLHQEADFYKRMARDKYESFWKFIFGSLMAEFFIFLGLLFFGLLIASTISVFKEGVSEFSLAGILGEIVMILFISFTFFLGCKISKRLSIAFKKQNKKFKKKAIIILIFPTLSAIFILIFLYILFSSLNFSY